MRRKLLIPAILGGVLILTAGSVLAWQWNRDRTQVKVLTIATTSQNGEYHRFGQALAQVIALHQPHLRLQVRETSGSRENMALLDSGQVQLAIAQSDTPTQPSIQAVAALFPETFHLIVQADTSIRSIPDLRGKRIALMPRDSGSYLFFKKLLQHYGLSTTDLEAIPLPAAEAQEQFRQGKVDGLFRSIALGNSGMQALVQSRQARFIPLDQVAALLIANPYLQASQVPKGMYSGNPAIPATDLPSVSVQALLLTHQGVDSDLIYQIVRTLYEYRNELSAINPRAAALRPRASADSFGLPVNPGAESFYSQNEPSWLERYAESMAFLITVVGILGSCLWQLRSHLAKKQKNRADAYNLKVLSLVEQAAECPSIEELELLRRQLFKVFKRVVEDVDQDKLTPEAFQIFSVSWDVMINTLRHRELILLQHGKSFTPAVTAKPQPELESPTG